MAQFLLNANSMTYTIAASSEEEARGRAEALSKERRAIVSYYEVQDRRAVLLGTFNGRGEGPLVAAPPKKKEEKVSKLILV